MIFTIELPEKISTNKIYAGVHFRERMRHKEDYYYAVLAADVPPYAADLPISAHYHFSMRGKQLDISNHSYMQKLIEDALVQVGVLPGDDPTYVARVTITASPAKKREPETVRVDLSPYSPTYRCLSLHCLIPRVNVASGKAHLKDTGK